MPQPTQGDVHIDSALTDISVAYFQNPGNFVADQVFPAVSVPKQSNKYHVWDRNNFNLDSMEKRADGQESAGGGLDIGEDNYFCDVWGLHKDIGDQTRANEDPAVQLDRSVTGYLSQQALIRREKAWAGDFFTTSVWTTDKTGGTDFTKWDDAASDPENDVDTGKNEVLKNTGFEPNTLVVSYPVHLALKRHPLIKDRTKYTSSDSITAAIIANFFEIPRYLVAKSNSATNAEGAASDTYDFNLGKKALLCYVPASPGLLIPSAGYTFNWSGFMGSGNGVRMKRFRMENLASDRLEIETSFDQKLVSADLGYFFDTAVD